MTPPPQAARRLGQFGCNDPSRRDPNCNALSGALSALRGTLSYNASWAACKAKSLRVTPPRIREAVQRVEARGERGLAPRVYRASCGNLGFGAVGARGSRSSLAPSGCAMMR